MTDLKRRKAMLDQDGYTVIEGVLTETERKNLNDRLNRTYAGLQAGGREIYPDGVGKTERLILNLHNKDAAFIELIDHPTVFPLVQHMMQQGSYRDSEPFIVTQFSARDPHLGVPAQQLHIDSRFPGPAFPLMCIALWMINDFTIESGGTRLVPGSHRRPSYPDNGITYQDEIIVQAPAGSVVLYNGSSWHGGGAKQRQVDRWSAIVSYARWFVKPAFDMTQNTPSEIYAGLTPERRELFGFTTIPAANEHERARARINKSELPDAI